jgi:predicted GNAT superfamily acetyltransferase
MADHEPTDAAIFVRPARDIEDFDACVELQRAVWGLADVEVNSRIQLLVTARVGGLIQLAETADGRAVGFAYAFVGVKHGIPYLHSDLLGVRPEFQGRGLGTRLKWAQRDEALARGITRITWTFDPLQARNADLNLRRLGAVGVEFVQNLYGITTASLHHALPTDRLEVVWELESERVQRLAEGGRPARTVPAPRLPRINEVRWQAGWPVSSRPRLRLEAPKLLLEIPASWDELCRAAPRTSRRWHAKLRSAFNSYLARGYVVDGFAPTQQRGKRRPLYVLSRIG